MFEYCLLNISYYNLFEGECFGLYQIFSMLFYKQIKKFKQYFIGKIKLLQIDIINDLNKLFFGINFCYLYMNISVSYGYFLFFMCILKLIKMI